MIKEIVMIVLCTIGYLFTKQKTTIDNIKYIGRFFILESVCSLLSLIYYTQYTKLMSLDHGTIGLIVLMLSIVSTILYITSFIQLIIFIVKEKNKELLL